MPVPVAKPHSSHHKKSPSLHSRRPVPTRQSSQTIILEHHDDHEDDTHSLVIEELTAAQGTLAVISALLASFSFAGLTCLPQVTVTTSSPLIVTLYHTATSLSIAMQLFVCILCTTLEQQGKVARGLSMARKNHKLKHIYDDQLHAWYSNPAFARFRTGIIQLFLLSTPLFALSLSLLCLLTIPEPHCYVPAVVFAGMGGAVLWYLLWLMKLFREGVLGGAGVNDTVIIGEEGGEGKSGEDAVDQAVDQAVDKEGEETDDDEFFAQKEDASKKEE